jgi:RNA polymerase sigma-70 factor (ECF subfamily)
MLLLRKGHTKAFAVLVGRYQEMILGFACRFLGDHQIGEEVAQEVFLTVWADRNKYHAKGRFKSYLWTLTFNRCHVFARSRSRHIKKLENYKKSLPEENLESTPLAKVLECAQAEEVRIHLSNLPEAMRRSIILRYLNGLSIKEIAEATKSPLGTVKSNIFRGLNKLHESFTRGSI